MEYGCIGRRLSHSFSRTIHGLIGRYDYELREIAPEDLAAFMAERNFRGINVTIPYKEEVIPYLHELSPRAKSISAVNTVVNRNGLLYGFNTDFGGMQALLAKIGVDIRGKKALVLGSGGTSQTARAVLQSGGAGEIYRVSRSGKDGAITYDQARFRHRDAQIIINTTPCGMFPDVDEQPVDLSCFSDLRAVADAIYNPLRTDLILQAQEMGVPAEGGLYMLVAQAVLAAELFSGQSLPEGETQRIYDELLSRTRNPVLIGMPGSGKTTVGRLLAKELGRKLLDVDELIVQRAGCSISRIFESRGEDRFRQLEADVIAEISRQNGVIIACGGGSVLREDNVRRLARNGRLIFLDRSPDRLLPTEDRPLANDDEKIKKLYQERLPVYLNAADEVVQADGPPEAVARSILRSML
ncbi:MAG: shikimate dehydrogenase [Firmicutes bacterium]|nr:shikimate dehydrogenase [Bacillota bacterium]